LSDVERLYAAADVFISASRHEGHSSAIGEALACGLPVVTSDIAGSALWRAAPGVLTFPSEDAGALAERIEQLLDDSPHARAAAGAQARGWAEGHLGIASWCAQVCALYRTLL